MNFLRNLLATVVGFFISIFILFALSIAIFSAVASISSSDVVSVDDNSVLVIDLEGSVVDYMPEDEFGIFDLLNQFEDNKIFDLHKVLNAISLAKEDEQIKGLVIKTSYSLAGYTQIKNIREAIKDFKQSKKFVYAYGDFFTQKAYYLSTVADSVFVNPNGFVQLTGFTAERLFFKKAFDKMGLKMEIIRSGKYKSAMETYMRDDFSKESKEQIRPLLSAYWNELALGLQKDRKFTNKELNDLTTNFDGRNPFKALDKKMVDGVVYETEFDDFIDTTKVKDFKTVSLSKYIISKKGEGKKVEKDKIAIVYAQGEIIFGKGDPYTIGQKSIVEALKKIEEKDNIKAIVLRVNSPGGSAIASDIITRQVVETGKKKPIVISMGNLAASGGYYIAMGAKYIVAEPTTITGSIGVFAVVPNWGTISKKIGITSDQISTHNDYNYNPFRKNNKRFINVTRESVDTIYDRFINIVAKARKMTYEQVNELAQGRVWSGVDAKEKGLVDEIGNIDVALKKAAELAKVDKFSVVRYPRYEFDFQDMFSGRLIKQKVLKTFMSEEQYKIFEFQNSLKNMKENQMRIPYRINVK